MATPNYGYEKRQKELAKKKKKEEKLKAKADRKVWWWRRRFIPGRPGGRAIRFPRRQPAASTLIDLRGQHAAGQLPHRFV